MDIKTNRVIKSFLLSIMFFVLIIFLLLICLNMTISVSYAYTTGDGEYYTCPGMAVKVQTAYDPDVSGTVKYTFTNIDGMTVSGKWPNYTIVINREGTFYIDANSNTPFLPDNRYIIHVEHDYNDTYTVDQAPTCTEPGIQSIHCNRCNALKDKMEIPSKGHSWEETPQIDIAATCTDNGMQSIHCINCNERKDIKVIEKMGHDLIHYEAKAPTYTDYGWYEYDLCSRCGYSTFIEIPPLTKKNITNLKFTIQEPVSEDEIIFSASAEGEGFSLWDVFWLDDAGNIYTGYNDNGVTTFDKEKYYTVNIVIKLEDGYTVEVNDNGYTSDELSKVSINSRTPTYCGWVDYDNQLFAYSYSFDHTHSYVDVVTKATLYNNGAINKQCKYCGDIKSIEVINLPRTIELVETDFIYDGYEKTPHVRVTDRDGKVIEASNYDVFYSDNRNVGTGTATIVFKNNYSGTTSLYFSIKPLLNGVWSKENGEWYFYKNDGVKLVNGWAQDSIGWMWMGSDGKITKSKWIKSNGEWYYLKSNGYMAVSEWTKDSYGWMWMDPDGKITKSKWIKSNSEWYYLKSTGYMAASEWAKDSYGWMWMGADGKITKSKWIKSNSEWYYLKSTGYMATSEWAKDSYGWMWMGADGKITKSKWIKSNGEWYYLKSNGYMATGSMELDGRVFTFDSNGVWLS